MPNEIIDNCLQEFDKATHKLFDEIGLSESWRNSVKDFFRVSLAEVYTKGLNEGIEQAEAECSKSHTSAVTKALEGVLEKMPKEEKHIIDTELYEDSGGGSMCEVCGKQGIELEEKCDRNNEFNTALLSTTNIIKEEIKKYELERTV